MAVILGSIKQETNHFSAMQADMDTFKDTYLLHGDEILTRLTGSRTGEGAYIDVLKREGKKIIPTIAASCGSCGPVKEETFRMFQKELLKGIEKAENIEAIVIMFHGAMVSENCDDTEGDTLERIRRLVGPDIPISIACDAHAHCTPKMMVNADVITGYRSFPHVDEYETAKRSIEILLKKMKGIADPVMAMTRVPMLISPHAEPDYSGPMAEILNFCKELEKEEGILDVSFFPVQPWLDIPNTYTVAYAIADGNQEKAQAAADRLAQNAWDLRKKFKPELIKPEDAVDYAMSKKSGTYTLAESSDAPPAGAPGDGVNLLRTLLSKCPLPAPAYLIVVDPEAVKAAHASGIGNIVSTMVGYTCDPRWGEPVNIEGKVTALQNQTYYFIQSRNICESMGKTAMIQIDNISLIVCSNSFMFFDPNAYRALGLDLKNARILSVKSTLHFREYFGPICEEIFLLDTIGPSTSRFETLDWKRLSRPIWPLDSVEWGLNK